MAVRPPAAASFGMSKRARVLMIIGVALAVLILAASLVAQLLVRYWWYQETGYTEVFWTTWRTRAVLFLVFGAVAALVIGLNAYLAYRLRPAFRPLTAEQQNLEQYRRVIEPRSRLLLIVTTLAAFLFGGYAAQSQWRSYLTWANSTDFGRTDPQFGLDVSFYTFELPFLRFSLTYLFAVVGFAIVIAAAIHYLYGGIRLNSPGQRFATATLAHLAVLLGVFVLLKALGYWFDRYDLMFSTRGKNFYGAAAADVNAMLPAKTILAIVAIICALAFFATLLMKNFAIPAMALALMIVASLAIGTAYPAIYNRFVVTPNANVKEAEYIERAMDATLAAYGLDEVDYQAYPAKSTAEPGEIRADAGTIPHLRLLDPNVISEVVQQNEQVVRVYSFADRLDIDRYTIDGESKDYVVAVRELDPSRFSEAQRNWINMHTYYTHGYGFIAAPANEVDEKGMPNFVNSGFEGGEIEVKQPRIYFGELNNEYSIVGTEDGKHREYDRPEDSEGQGERRTTYDGEGGVPVDNLFRKAVFAIRYAEGNFLLNSSIGSNSKIIYDRTPRERVEAVAPFLTADGDPYPAVIDGRITWIIDAYTTSDGYPYAAQMSLRDTTADAQTGTGTAALPDETVNYVRNSVKATVDAYDGTVTLYEWDENDPVLKTWQSAYPGAITPKSEIPEGLADHFRYPEDLFKIQRQLLTQYHVSDPSKFYGEDGFWKVAADPTGGGAGDQPPFYVRSQLPGQDVSTFKITSPLTANNKDNITAYMAAESDPENYGKITVLTMPPAQNTFGPRQVQNQFTNDEEIKTKLNWLRQGNADSVDFGNLLTVPIAGGLLYVEPVYVRSTYPTLQFVLLQYGGQLTWAPTIKEGLDKLFGPGAGDNAANTANEDAADINESTTDPNGTTGGSGGGDASTQQKINDANTALQAAISAYEAAAQSGDYATMGQAQQQIIDASKALDAAVKEQQAATPSAEPTDDGG
ncbi:UPF0182 family protein [Blastococcus sp. Marseille-P5729]|uniref:UPF0182 family membrane protein n=1 Tax=Blastococcus sp. Marseille-P5729 TaxID=2086582 RepID=UPI000D0FD1D2|nr:UPF0182 family protein [Blastococcus sp. Marseille-P5729]